MLNILDKQQMDGILSGLREDAKPLWGKMSPQHMIEHLSTLLMVSTGKKKVNQFTSQEEAAKIKASLIYGDSQMPRGVKSPLIGDEPPPYRHSSFKDAITELHNELYYFDSYFKSNPAATHIQPRMGALNQKEWHILHNKHFAHHFRQYALLPEL